MKLLCASNSLSFVHSLRIALDGDGIETYCSDADSTLSSIAGPMTGIAARLYVLHEEDWARAIDIMRELSGPAPTTKSAPKRKALPTWAWASIATVVVALLAIILGD
jgi:Putative prokaryotic signal transducing protein